MLFIFRKEICNLTEILIHLNGKDRKLLNERHLTLATTVCCCKNRGYFCDPYVRRNFKLPQFSRHGDRCL